MTKQLTNPKELLKQQLAEQNERIAKSDSIRIKMKAGIGFQAPGQEEYGEQLDVIVVDYTLVHSFYHGAYDKENIVPPDCYANNRLFANLQPLKTSPDRQADHCAVCPQNVFGSAPNGSAKACRNSRLLAVIPADNPEKAPIWTLSIPPTSTKHWDKYVKLLMKANLAPLFVRTAITLTDEEWILPVFNLIEAVGEDDANSAISRLEDARKILDRVPDFNQNESGKDQYKDDVAA